MWSRILLKSLSLFFIFFVTAVTGGHHTVEHVDATLDGFKDILWRTDTHQVTGTVLRQDLVDHLDHIVHHLCGLSDSQSSDGGTTTIVQSAQHIADVFGGILTQVFIGTPLYDGEQRLVIAVEGLCLVEALDASFQPALREPEALLSILVIALAGRAFIESHHDVCTYHTFCVHHILRREDVFGTIDVAAELTTFFLQLADTRQREDLKTARVRQNGTIPGVELV